jgi:hypothetical protein
MDDPYDWVKAAGADGIAAETSAAMPSGGS